MSQPIEWSHGPRQALMKVEIDPDDVQKLNADSRGRVYLGSEYADMEDIEVAVLNDPSDTSTNSDGNGNGGSE